jgi:fatty acid synthase
VACHNGPDSSTISGPTEDMEKFVKELQDQGTFARLVNVANIAYHSRYIKPAAPGLLKYLKEILPEPVARSAKWISTSNKEEDWETHLAKHSSAEYHTNNLLNSVLFEEGLKHIPKDSVLIEIAPHGLLQAILKRSVKSGCTNVPLTQRGYKSGVEFLLSALGKLYLAGLNMNITNLLPKLEYPVSRGTECLADLAKWEHSEVWRTGLEEKLKSLFGIRDFQVTLNSEEFRECVGHQIGDKIILPCSAYLVTSINSVLNVFFNTFF